MVLPILLEVVLGVVSAILIVGAGVSGLRLMGVPRDAVSLGLAPAVGVGLLAVLTTWTQVVHLSPTVTGLLVLGMCLAGLAMAARDFLSHKDYMRGHRVELALVLAALIVPVVVLAQALSIQKGVPDYSFDGPFHAEAVEALRRGEALADFGWYPTGFHGPVAALLALAPWIDSASGVVGWAAGLTIVAPFALFGFGTAIWRDTRVGAAAALLLAVTSTFPYEAQLYSEWPMAVGLLLTIGLWTTAIQFVRAPSVALSFVAGLLAGAMPLTHGTEVYTAAIGLIALAVGHWRTILKWRVAAHAGLALAVAIVFAASYFPVVANWTRAGGAVEVATGYFGVHQSTISHEPLLEALFWSSATSSGLLVDLPIRLALLAVGTWFALRRQRGRVIVVLTAAFLGLVVMFRYVGAAPIRDLFAYTFPWGVDGRLLWTVPVLAAPLGGLGAVWVAAELTARAWGLRPHSGRIALQWRTMSRRALTFGVALGLASAGMVAAKFGTQTAWVVTYSANDAAAFDWLRQHAQPGELLLNDGAADAGIWAPYKADVAIALPHNRGFAPDSPEQLVRENLGQLSTRADLRQAACELGLRYVYRGEANSTSEYRLFPALEELRSNRALEEIFSSGQAAVFRTRLDCASSA